MSQVGRGHGGPESARAKGRPGSGESCVLTPFQSDSVLRTDPKEYLLRLGEALSRTSLLIATQELLINI